MDRKIERDAGFLPWQNAHPRDGEICLAVRMPDRDEEEFSTDDPVEFLGWLADNYPIVLNSAWSWPPTSYWMTIATEALVVMHPRQSTSGFTARGVLLA